MIRRLLALLTLLAALWLPVTAQAAKTYYAERFDVRLGLQPDGTLAVTETIVFHFEGGPFTYVFRELAYTELDDIDQVRAALDGEALSPGTGPGQAEIGSGRPLRVTWHLAPTSDATHTFTLTYRVLGAVRRADADVLIWRAIPEEHDYQIRATTVTLVYPAPLQPLETPTLNRPAALEASTVGVSFMTSDLGENQDVIVTARFAAGSLITTPPNWQARAETQAAAVSRAWPIGVVAGLITLTVAGLGLWMVARANQRNLVAEPPTSTSIPPGDLPPALVGRLTGQSANFMGALFDLAQRGWLEIREQAGWLGSKRYLLELKPGPEPLRPHEQALLNDIFKPGQTSLAMSEVPTRLAGHRSFEQQLETELVEQGWFDPQRKAARSRSGVLWLVGLLAAMGLFIGGVLWGGTLLDNGRGDLNWPAIVVGVGAGLFIGSAVGLVYAGTLSPLTPAGEIEAARWKGFRLYLKDVSRGREPATRPDYFERYLPLAAVFGLGAAWAKYFQRLGGVPLPVWFHATAGSAGDFGAMIAVMSASDSAGAASAGGGAGASGGGASGAG